jgi:hypothetical protein
MARSSERERGAAPSAGSAETVVNLARKHLGMVGSMFYAPSIPPAKIDNARLVHARHLPEDEELLVLFDGTVFGSADEGFIVTATRLCWKNLWEHPRQIEWANIDTGTLSPEPGLVRLAGGTVDVLGDMSLGVVALFQELASRARLPDLGPYRAAERTIDTPARIALPEATIVALTRTHVGEVSDVFYRPSIPPSKEARARRAHAAHLTAGEPVIVLYDDTLFGSAEEGFLLTPDRLCWKNIAEEAKQLPWSLLEPDKVEATGAYVKVLGGWIQLTGRRELLGPMASLLRALGEEAKRLGEGG